MNTLSPSLQEIAQVKVFHILVKEQGVGQSLCTKQKVTSQKDL
jgi:hypothetical protein